MNLNRIYLQIVLLLVSFLCANDVLGQNISNVNSLNFFAQLDTTSSNPQFHCQAHFDVPDSTIALTVNALFEDLNGNVLYSLSFSTNVESHSEQGIAVVRQGPSIWLDMGMQNHNSFKIKVQLENANGSQSGIEESICQLN